MAKIKVTIELLDQELKDHNPDKIVKTLECNGMLAFYTDPDGKEETTGLECVSVVNSMAIAEGLNRLPFGHRVVSQAMMMGVMGMGKDDGKDDDDDPDPDAPEPGHPAFDDLMEKLGLN